MRTATLKRIVFDPVPERKEEIILEWVRRGIYEIDGEGRIWRTAIRRCNGYRSWIVPIARKRAEKMHLTGSAKGYLVIHTSHGGKPFYPLAHRVVWTFFSGPIPAGLTINHKNGIRYDNRLSNLELATHAEQRHHALHVLKVNVARGEQNSKLTDGDVIEIRKRRALGESQGKLGIEFGITRRQVELITTRKRWKHI